MTVISNNNAIKLNFYKLFTTGLLTGYHLKYFRHVSVNGTVLITLACRCCACVVFIGACMNGPVAETVIFKTIYFTFSCAGSGL